MEALDEATEKLIALARELPHFAQMLSIDGTGDVLAALLCAEIGEPSRFSCRNGLVAYAGLDPTILQSGRNDGLHYSITRKGNAFLRKYLYLAVENMIMSKADNAITRFYSKKAAASATRRLRLRPAGSSWCASGECFAAGLSSRDSLANRRDFKRDIMSRFRHALKRESVEREKTA